MTTFNRQIAMWMLVGLVAAGVVGCGNKGPLVLPERPQADEPVEDLFPAPEQDAQDSPTDG